MDWRPLKPSKLNGFMVAVLSFLLQRQYQTQLTPRNVQKETPSLAQLPQLICTGFVTQLTGFMREERFFFSSLRNKEGRKAFHVWMKHSQHEGNRLWPPWCEHWQLWGRLVLTCYSARGSPSLLFTSPLKLSYTSGKTSVLCARPWSWPLVPAEYP